MTVEKEFDNSIPRKTSGSCGNENEPKGSTLRGKENGKFGTSTGIEPGREVDLEFGGCFGKDIGRDACNAETSILSHGQILNRFLTCLSTLPVKLVSSVLSISSISSISSLFSSPRFRRAFFVTPTLAFITALTLFVFLTPGMSWGQQPWIITPGVGVGPFKIDMHINKVTEKLGKYEYRNTLEVGAVYCFPKYGIYFETTNAGFIRSIYFYGMGKGKTYRTTDNVKMHTEIEDVIDKWGRPIRIQEDEKYKYYIWRGIKLATMKGSSNRVSLIIIE